MLRQNLSCWPVRVRRWGEGGEGCTFEAQKVALPGCHPVRVRRGEGQSRSSHPIWLRASSRAFFGSVERVASSTEDVHSEPASPGAKWATFNTAPVPRDGWRKVRGSGMLAFCGR